MSRAFVKNDASDDQVLVPRRAPLTPGIPNYVTPRGTRMLRTELAELEAERARVQHNTESDAGKRDYQLASFSQRIKELIGRIESSKVVDIQTQRLDRVCFGVTVIVQTITGSIPEGERRLTIVGVDEADPGWGWLSAAAVIGTQGAYRM